MKYGDLPKQVGYIDVICKEMMFYQYLPIKMRGSDLVRYEKRLGFCDEIIGKVIDDFIEEHGYEVYLDSYVYLTAKYMFQLRGGSFNRTGYHSDGFLTDDINYVWYSNTPTVFNTSDFKLTLDDSVSMKEMEEQALKENEITFDNKVLLRLNQYSIHRVAEVEKGGMRLFIKISFSKDKYDLIGNAHNYELDYNWPMVERKVERNIPQSNLKQKD